MHAMVVTGPPRQTFPQMPHLRFCRASKLDIVNQIDIVRCADCRMVFADSPSEVIYEHNKCDEAARGVLPPEPVYTVAYYDDLLRRMTRMVGRTNYALLEFGCGSGMLLRRARRLVWTRVASTTRPTQPRRATSSASPSRTAIS
jgi:hypothetical protein